jgi:nucleotide-binding universal stress UspA family protein
VLVHVIEQNAPQVVHGERHLTNETDACEYLSTISTESFPGDIQIECHVHTEEIRNVARSIVDHVSEFGSDLIMMCSHGKSGLRDFVIGSIAMQVIGMGKTPVMLIRPSVDSSQPPAFTFNRLLVALDGKTEHETGLEIASDLARKMGSVVHLLNVVETRETLSGGRAAAGRLLPVTAAAMLEMTEEYALQYLKQKADILSSEGVSVEVEVRRGEPAREIVKAAEQAGCGMIVLGTHGKSGMGAFWAGSVAPKAAGMSPLPLLLVPVTKK